MLYVKSVEKTRFCICICFYLYKEILEGYGGVVGGGPGQMWDKDGKKFSLYNFSLNFNIFAYSKFSVSYFSATYPSVQILR